MNAKATMDNYDVLKEGGAMPVKMWTRGVSVEDDAKEQLVKVARMPFIYKWVAAMPDCHGGTGSTIGTVIATKGAIIPAAVGVDIGCGMMACRTTLTANDLPTNLAPIRIAIEESVPHGRSDNGGRHDSGAWKFIPSSVEHAWKLLLPGYEKIIDKYPGISKANTVTQLGTLGTGNHFIEVCLDTENKVWIMLHSGSRGVGNKIGSTFIDIAQRKMEKWKISIPHKDLAYLPKDSAALDDYWNALNWAQQFAKVNRTLMMERVLEVLRSNPSIPSFQIDGQMINCHHNYATIENHYNENVYVTRKGAVRARIGDRGIIPGSMGAKSFIVMGKGNPESFHSCSHGAGRKMSRTKAKERFSLEDHAKATEGVECRKDADVIDETPGAYKDIDAVMAAQADLVEIEHTLKQIICVKG